MKNLQLFLTNNLDNRFYSYEINQMEIYRIKKESKLKIYSNDVDLFDENLDSYNVIGDIYQKNGLFKISQRYKREHNLIFSLANTDFYKIIFNAIYENLSLITSTINMDTEFSFDSSKVELHYNFLLDKNSTLKLVPVITFKDTIMISPYLSSLSDTFLEVEKINNIFKKHYFKEIVDKTINEMSKQEIDLIRMYYTN